MPASGSGVVQDTAVPAARMCYSDDTHADVQYDQRQTEDVRCYDYSKIWSCMGRAGSNLVLRDGMVEEGDPIGPWTAGTIESVDDLGVPLGVQYWNALTGYNPWGGSLDAGAFTLYGVIDRWDEILFHMQAGLPNAPSLAYEYWNGAAWSALTLLLTPDWTCATTLNQRLRFVRPSNWASTNAAALGLLLANAGTYWYIRLRLTADYLFAAPVSNHNYKDHMKGHWRKFFLQYDLKRGDDSNNFITNFRDDGNFSLKFRDGKGIDGKTNIGGNYADHGSVDTQTTRHTLGKAWSIVAPGKRLTIFGGTFSNGLIATIPAHEGTLTGGDFLLRSNLLDLKMYNVMVNGYSGSSVCALGGSGVAAVGDLVHLRITPHPLFDASTASMGIINVFGAQSTALVDKLIVDVRRRTGGVKWTHGIRSAVSGAIFEGIMLTDDDFTGGVASAQLVSTSSALFRNVDWGGPDLKAYATDAREFRYLRFGVRQHGTETPLSGIWIRVTASDGNAQMISEQTDANGRIDQWIGSDWTGPSSGLVNKALAKVSKWLGDVETATDVPMRIEVNPSDLPGFNPLYMSLDIRHAIPRRLVYDFATSAFVLADWQRDDVEVLIALPLAPVGGGPPEPIRIDDVIVEVDGSITIDAEVPEIIT